MVRKNKKTNKSITNWLHTLKKKALPKKENNFFLESLVATSEKESKVFLADDQSKMNFLIAFEQGVIKTTFYSFLNWKEILGIQLSGLRFQSQSRINFESNCPGSYILMKITSPTKQTILWENSFSIKTLIDENDISPFLIVKKPEEFKKRINSRKYFQNIDLEIFENENF